MSPVFILGQQHSGNTMLATIFDKSDDFFCTKGESSIFEHLKDLKALPFRLKIIQIRRFLRISAGGHWSQKEKETIDEFFGYLDTFKEKDQNDSTIDIYGKALNYLAHSYGKKRWAQKATSYMFYADEIVKQIPDAKMIFLLRNPWDIAASIKRRGNTKQILRMVWGWNKRSKLTERYVKQMPEHFMCVRYEDLVKNPDLILEKIFSFVSSYYKKESAKIEHVNPSEAAYRVIPGKAGVNQTRLYYFRNVLSSEEKKIIGATIRASAVKKHYPELTDYLSKRGVSGFILAVPLWLQSISTVIRDLVPKIYRHPHYVIDRIMRRV